MELSHQVCSLWGKTDYEACEYWLPLFVHLSDTAYTAGFLWDSWLPSGVRREIARVMRLDEGEARKFVTFIAGCHDLGKATPVFQGKPVFIGGARVVNPFSGRVNDSGLSINLNVVAASAPGHAWCGAQLLYEHLSALLRRCVGGDDIRRANKTLLSIASIIALHHGATPCEALGGARTKKYASQLGMTGRDGDWRGAQAELVYFVTQVAGMTDDEILQFCARGLAIPANVAVLILGVCIMADWLASNAEFFPLLPVVPQSEEGRLLQNGVFELDGLRARAVEALQLVDILPPWEEACAPNLNDQAAFAERFNFSSNMTPRPVQMDSVRAVDESSDPGLMIIEAPMGEGKTEAALAAAELLAVRSGRGGVLVALPTMATTDAMFSRVRAWLDRLPRREGCESRSVYLAHGKARLNDEFQGIVSTSRHILRQAEERIEKEPDESGSVSTGLSERIAKNDQVIATDWLFGRKKGLLANFVVCTIDQVLMGALRMKHLALRDLGLANKVLVIDECHAYDAYMQVYLKRILEWLGSWGTPVVLLSATLPEGLRSELLEAYSAGRRVSDAASDAAKPKLQQDCASSGCLVSEADGLDEAYPRITVADADAVRAYAPEPSGRAYDVTVRPMGDEVPELIKLVGQLASGGGCIGVICDTVARAQEAASSLAEVYGSEVLLAHARFTDADRMAREARLRALLGPAATLQNGLRPHRLIVVGTQVLEQSLDIDFDALITDVAPVDLLFQRMGRMHRHDRGAAGRPECLQLPMCYIRGVREWTDDGPTFDRGVSRVYCPATLMEACAVLGITARDGTASVQLPGDIASMVRRAYGDRVADMIPLAWRDAYDRAVGKRNDALDKKRRKADTFLIDSAQVLLKNGAPLTSWCADPADPVRRDADWGPRAVRDTTETVEVLLLRSDVGNLRLLPWIGDMEHGVEAGSTVPTDMAPRGRLQAVIANSAVRLPAALCSPDNIDELISELEKRCGSLLGAWRDAPLLAGSLVLVLEDIGNGVFGTDLCGRFIRYDERVGIIIDK